MSKSINLTDDEINGIAEVLSKMEATDMKELSDVINDIAKKLEKSDKDKSREGKKEARAKKRAERKELRAKKRAERKAKRAAKRAARKAGKKEVSAEDLNKAETFFKENEESLKNIETFLNDEDREEETYELVQYTGLDEELLEDMFDALHALRG